MTASNLVGSLKNALEKTVVKNGIWMYLYHFFNSVFSLLIVPYITRVLGANKYGVFSIAVNLINYLQVLVEYGFTMSATRKIALGKQDESRLFSVVVASRMLLLAASIVISGGYILLHLANRELCLCVAVLFMTLLGFSLQTDWFFQGKQDMKFITILCIISRSVSLALIFLLVKGPSDILTYCVLFSLTPLISGLLGILIARGKYGIRFQKVSFAEVRQELKDGWYVFTTQLSSKVFGAIGVTFLGIFAAEEEVGIFSAIQKIPNTLILCWVPISQVIYPVSSKKFSESWRAGRAFITRLRNTILPLFVILSAIVCLFSRQAVSLLFGAEYVGRSYWVIPLLVWMNLSIFNAFTGVQSLLASGNDKKYSKCFQIGVAFTVLVNFVLIYLFKGDGAAYAPAISELFLSILLIREIRRCDRENKR